MRLGIFGGSFDPVHYGHLLLAEFCREQCQLDQVLWMPAATPPHKQHQQAAPEQRLEMLKLAVGGQESFRVSDLEIRRGGISYTIDTLDALRSERPEDELFLLLGADALHDLPGWKEPGRICALVVPVVVGRQGFPLPDVSAIGPLVSPERLAEVRKHQVQMPLVELSSREIRRRVASKLSIRYQTPRAVEQYILAQGLYAEASSKQYSGGAELS